MRAVGARTGVDYTEDAAVSDLLARHRHAVDQASRGTAGWIGGLALAAGVIWPFVGNVVPATAGKPLLAYAPAGPLLLVAVACLTLVRLRWKRALMHKELAGYREVLGLARAYGIEPAHAGVAGGPQGRRRRERRHTDPEVRAGGTVRRRVPHTLGSNSTAETGRGVGVRAHRRPGRLARRGGLANAVRRRYRTRGDGQLGRALGLAALALVPLAVVVWITGHRQGSRKAGLRPEAEAYARAVVAARAAGAETPKLSPQLRALLDD
ncbi:hypothetical protein ACFQV4_37090 [Streptomyces thermocarboxydus]